MPAIADPVTRLIEANMGLIYTQVNEIVRISQNHADYDEAVQVGRVALWSAIKQYNPAHQSKYDAKRNVKLSTYAVVSIQRSLRRWMQLRDRHGFSKVGDGNKKDWWKTFVPVIKPARLDQQEDEEHPSMIEVQAKEHRREQVAQNEISESVRHSLGRLQKDHPRLAGMIYQRHFLGHTLDAIGISFGLSKERIRQLLRKAIDYLREDLGDDWRKAA